MTGFITDASSAYPWLPKDPSATLDYTLDWSLWLGTDTILGTPVWLVPTRVTQNTITNTPTTATIWLSGGTAGTLYLIACKITTVGGRTDERTFELRGQQR